MDFLLYLVIHSPAINLRLQLQPFLLKIIRALGTVSAKACITAILLTLGIFAQETLQHQGGNLAIIAALSWAKTACRDDGDLRNTTPATCGP